MGHTATVAIDSAKAIEALQQLDTQRKEQCCTKCNGCNDRNAINLVANDANAVVDVDTNNDIAHKDDSYYTTAARGITTHPTLLVDSLCGAMGANTNVSLPGGMTYTNILAKVTGENHKRNNDLNCTTAVSTGLLRQGAATVAQSTTTKHN